MLRLRHRMHHGRLVSAQKRPGEWARASLMLLAVFTGVTPASGRANLGVRDRSIALPAFPENRTFEAFVSCQSKLGRIVVRASGSAFALVGRRWKRFDGSRCSRVISPVFITPDGATLSAGDGDYRVALLAPTLSDDRATRLRVSGHGVGRDLEISQSLLPLEGEPCNGNECFPSKFSVDRPVTVEGYNISHRAYLVVRSFRGRALTARLSLISLQYITNQLSRGDTCVGNVRLAWSMNGNSTIPAKRSRVCR